VRVPSPSTEFRALMHMAQWAKPSKHIREFHIFLAFFNDDFQAFPTRWKLRYTDFTHAVIYLLGIVFEILVEIVGMWFLDVDSGVFQTEDVCNFRSFV